LPEFNERLSEFNKRLSEFNKRLSEFNERLSKFNERLSKFNERLSKFNERLSKFNQQSDVLGFVLLCSTQLTVECSQTQVHLVGKGSTNIGVNLNSNAYPTSVLTHPQPPLLRAGAVLALDKTNAQCPMPNAQCLNP
jgi:uncharacterized coiled-coil protein SlyX